MHHLSPLRKITCASTDSNEAATNILAINVSLPSMRREDLVLFRRKRSNDFEGFQAFRAMSQKGWQRCAMTGEEVVTQPRFASTQSQQVFDGR